MGARGAAGVGASVRLARPLSLEQRLAGNGPQYAGQALSLPPVLDPGPLPEWLAVEPERRERVLRLQALLLEVLTPELMARLAALGNGDLVLMAREEDEALWRLVCRQQLSGGGEERWREPLAERAGMLTPEQGWQAIYDQVYQQERRRPVLLLGALLHGADDMAPDGSEHGFALLLGGSDDGARPIRHLSRSQPTSAAEWSEDLAQLMRVQGDAKPPDCVWHSGLGQEELQGLGQALSARSRTGSSGEGAAGIAGGCAGLGGRSELPLASGHFVPAGHAGRAMAGMEGRGGSLAAEGVRRAEGRSAHSGTEDSGSFIVCLIAFKAMVDLTLRTSDSRISRFITKVDSEGRSGTTMRSR